MSCVFVCRSYSFAIFLPLFLKPDFFFFSDANFFASIAAEVRLRLTERCVCVCVWCGQLMSGFHGISLHLCVSVCVRTAGNDAVLRAGAEGEGGRRCVCDCLSGGGGGGSRTGAGRQPAQRASAGTRPIYHQAGGDGG